MAGIKISALPAGTTVADNDLIPYVDVSDTSEAATGTTKYMEKSLLGIPTSGTWTPVVSDVTNDASVTPGSGFYSNINGLVSGRFKAVVELSDPETTTDFNFSLPVLPTANFADAEKLIGCITPLKFLTVSQLKLFSTTGAKTGFVQVVATETATNTLSISFSYQV